MALQHCVPKTMVTKDLHYTVQLLNIKVTGTTWEHTQVCAHFVKHTKSILIVWFSDKM